MKLKKSLAAGAMVALICSVNVMGAFAAGGTDTSKANLTYKASDEVTPPVHPEEPDEDGKPYPDPGPGTQGPLSIDYISDLVFGEQKITTVDSVYTLADTDKWWDNVTVDGNNDPVLTDIPTYVQVSDNRGSAAGWTLKVEQTSPFTYQDTTDPTDIKYNHELKGTVITFKNITVNSQVEETAMWPSYNNAGTDVDVYYDSGNSTAEIMLGAKNNEGAGTFVTKFGKITGAATDNGLESVELFVPGKSVKYEGTYEATLTWTLTDVPIV